MFNIQKAVRKKIWCKVALIAPSGGGKTFGALRMATGMRSKLAEIGEETKILMANTEASRGLYYANEFDYDIVDVPSPHSPEKYVELIDYAVDQGYKILILDSSSHEWEGKGGCLEIHSLGGGTYQAWGKVTPRHNAFLYAIADSPIHIIATMRGKDQYEMERGETGKTTVKKLGVGAKQREGVEYEFTCSFLIDQASNMALFQKDNTYLFEDRGEFKISEKDGKEIIEWANSGDAVYVAPVRHEKTEQEILVEVNTESFEICSRVGSKTEGLMDIVKKYNVNSPKKIKKLDDAKQLLAELKTFEKELNK